MAYSVFFSRRCVSISSLCSEVVHVLEGHVEVVRNGLDLELLGQKVILDL